MLSIKPLFIASPEYNGFLSPLLKNTIDWIPRPESAPGHFGGLRGLQSLRILLSSITVDVMGQQLVVPYYVQAFNENGRLIDKAALAGLDDLLDQLVSRAARLS